MSNASARAAVTLFGEIAARAGWYEATMGEKPRYVLMSPADARTLADYLMPTRKSKARLNMVSGLEVHVIRCGGPLRVA